MKRNAIASDGTSFRSVSLVMVLFELFVQPIRQNVVDRRSETKKCFNFIVLMQFSNQWLLVEEEIISRDADNVALFKARSNTDLKGIG